MNPKIDHAAALETSNDAVNFVTCEHPEHRNLARAYIELTERVALLEKVAYEAKLLAEEARPHTDFQQLWNARDRVWKALAALGGRDA